MIKEKLVVLRENSYRYVQIRRLRNKDFTLISQNCFAGGIYQELNLQYNTPTIGLFLYPKCYLNMLESIEDINLNNLTFIEESKYNINFKKKYPIAILDNRDIEIHFLHYRSEEEAKDKWIRRCSRINYNNIFVTFSDKDGCTEEEIKRFDKLRFKNKLFFSCRKHNISSLNIVLDKYRDRNEIGDIYNDRWSYRGEFNVTNWLNKGK